MFAIRVKAWLRSILIEGTWPAMTTVVDRVPVMYKAAGVEPCSMQRESTREQASEGKRERGKEGERAHARARARARERDVRLVE